MTCVISAAGTTSLGSRSRASFAVSKKMTRS
jgi:hypothetical protein